MKPAPFSYARPDCLDEALQLLATHDNAKILAGGQSLVPVMNFRMAAPSLLIDINRLYELAYIVDWEGHLAIGGMTRHVDVRQSPVVHELVPILAEAYEHVAHETVRNRGTLGGNLAHADPASEMPAVMLVLDAEMILSSVRGERRVAARDFFVTALTADLEGDEILTEIRIPLEGMPTHFAVDEYALRKGDLAIAGAIAAFRAEEGICLDSRIAVFGVADRPLRIAKAEAALNGTSADEPAAEAAAQEVVNSIVFEGGVGIDADYRRDLTRALVRRTILAARGKQA